MSKRILVMDDDESICKIFALMLNRLGYEVDTASRGETAIDSFKAARQSGAPFAAIILDLTVQEGMGGAETLRALRAIDPDVCAVCASGQSREAVSEDYERQGFKAVLPKPFRFQDVADCLKAVLGDDVRT